MTNVWTRGWFRVFILLVSFLGVFLLPFIFPPPYLKGLSAANVAGFNNKLASVVAAALGLLVFATHYFSGTTGERLIELPPTRLRPAVVLGSLTVVVAVICGFSYLVVASHLRYLNDAGYFIEQISKGSEFGRKLYSELEFPYGPLLFYSPLWVQRVLTPIHPSLTVAYCVALVVEQIAGLLMLAFVIDSLPMQRRWKTLFFLLCACLAVPVSMGINYTFFRFTMPSFFIVLLARYKRPWVVAAFTFLGQISCMAMSPEMGLAFLCASLAYALYYGFQEGRAWWIAAFSPCAATLAFFAVAGEGYLRMLGLFARGVNNLIVEPVPHILVFLFALIWLVPASLARFFRQERAEAPMLGALYISALATLPAGFGRADPQHTFFNGLPIYLLSFVAISSCNRVRQGIWATAVSVVLAFTAVLTALYPQCKIEYRLAFTFSVAHGPLLRKALTAGSHLAFGDLLRRHLREEASVHELDMGRLRSLIGAAPVATPVDIPPEVEEALKGTGQYLPTFYCFQTAVLDSTAEDRELRELNRSEWMLLPAWHEVGQAETPEDTQWMMGIPWPYRSRRPVYVAGTRFRENLAALWEPYASIGRYLVFKRRH